ncbi:MAG: tetratricopeptide repeat protein, partial [Acidobacteriota bacterium]|nr:tetratricopeptide repeat protein [Acidobacteriota bacterium]
HHLSAAATASPNGSLAHCEYGKALDQTQDWPRARTELETCARLDPNSVEAHYRLARIYRRLGLKELANKELAQRSAAAQRIAASNEAREQSVRAFLYTMVNASPPEKSSLGGFSQ